MSPTEPVSPSTDLPRGHQQSFRGNDDPSAMTVAMVDKTVGSLRELYDSKFAEKEEAVKLLHADMVRVPTLLDRATLDSKTLFDVKLEASKELTEEKLRGVDLRFGELEKRTRDLDEARATALIAALQAAKELVGAQSTASTQAVQTANSNFTKQIDTLLATFTGLIAGQDSKLTDLKDNVTRMASTMQGGQDARDTRRLDTGSVVGIIGGVVGVFTLIAAIGTAIIMLASRPQSIAPPVSYYVPPPITAPYVPPPSPVVVPYVPPAGYVLTPTPPTMPTAR